MNLDAVRAELSVLERLAYLNTGSFGPLPRRTAEVMAEQQRRSAAATYQPHRPGCDEVPGLPAPTRCR